MAPAHAMVFLSHKPSTDNWQFRVAVLVLAWEGLRTSLRLAQNRHPEVGRVLFAPAAAHDSGEH